MRKLINEPSSIVDDYLVGLEVSHPELDVDLENRLIYRQTPKEAGKVSLISGGGSGHEPLHSGFVGYGMLDAACVGEVFTSPTPSQIVLAFEKVDNGAGVLAIVKNYAGDRMNFEIAAERAERQGIQVGIALIDDDVSGATPSDGRRGIGLTLMAEKILGAAAEEGLSLDKLCHLAEELRSSGRSMGIGLTSCVHPSVGTPTFEIGPNEVEIGIGIHGEPGWRRANLGSSQEIAELLVDSILDDLDPPQGSSFVVLVNGMGGTPLVELYVVARDVASRLDKRGYGIDRFLVGSYVTSLEMAGCSVTLLQSTTDHLGRWDAEVSTPSLRWGLAA